MAESVVKLKAVCMICFKDAAFTKRLGSETKVNVMLIVSNVCIYTYTYYNIPSIQHNVYCRLYKLYHMHT